jgi:hypothetical protein
MKQLQDEYKREFGKKAGTAEFKSGFADPMAATTGGADPTANYLMAHYSSYLQNKGMDIPPTHQLAFPIGGRYAAGNMDMYGKTVRDPGFAEFGLGNEKRADFSLSFRGHPDRPVIDEQMSDLIVPGMQQPEWYGPASGVVHDVATQLGVDPRKFQEVAWAGHKAMKTRAEAMAKFQDKIDMARTPEEVAALQQQAANWKFQYEGPMIEHINQSIERTHRLTGMPKDEIVRRGVVRREIPMYGAAGGVGLGAAASLGDPAEAMEAERLPGSANIVDRRNGPPATTGEQVNYMLEAMRRETHPYEHVSLSSRRRATPLARDAGISDIPRLNWVPVEHDPFEEASQQ